MFNDKKKPCLIHKFYYVNNKHDSKNHLKGKLTKATSTGGPVTSARPKPTLYPSDSAAISSSVSKNIITLQSSAIAIMHQLREARLRWHTLYYTCNPQILTLSEASSANTYLHINHLWHHIRIEGLSEVGTLYTTPLSLC